ncbi:hypothetical protein NQZ68_020585 [Dissostichus eleginoides]|nr:hypothetical protein NQZ68_020585 [Dissostichus eleginoides]
MKTPRQGTKGLDMSNPWSVLRVYLAPRAANQLAGVGSASARVVLESLSSVRPSVSIESVAPRNDAEQSCGTIFHYSYQTGTSFLDFTL